MNMPKNVTICKNHEGASHFAAGLAAEAFVEKPHLAVTFAAGDTPFACYGELIRRQEAGALRLDKALYIGLDEWLGLGPGDEGSCIAAMRRGYYAPAGVPMDRIKAFNGLCQDVGAEVRRMGERLEAHPLDLAVLGVGVNGHIGFNEPGVPAAGDFSLVPLSDTTQRVGRKYFGGGPTPREGATITLRALLRAKRVVILATGISKQAAVQSVLAGREDLPLCAFLEHPGCSYVFDEEAAGLAK
jgi:6-phosphogluconolactonase/glucosamine-6-phosphate isomerase/deaminase